MISRDQIKENSLNKLIFSSILVLLVDQRLKKTKACLTQIGKAHD